jgi:hypothetical protein
MSLHSVQNEQQLTEVTGLVQAPAVEFDKGRHHHRVSPDLVAPSKVDESQWRTAVKRPENEPLASLQPAPAQSVSEATAQRAAALYRLALYAYAAKHGETDSGSQAANAGPIADAIASGPSALYLLALYAYAVVKSQGAVQDAFNSQEVTAFEDLEKAWDTFASDDGDFIKKQGQAMLYGGIATAGFGVAGSSVALVWGIGAPKGWFGGEDLEGQINAHFQKNPDEVEGTVKVDPTLEPLNENIPPEETQEGELESQGTGNVRRQETIEMRAEEAVTTNRTTTEDSEETESTGKTDEQKREDKRIDNLQEKLKQHTNKFQTYAGLAQQAATAGASVGQGVGQMNSAGTKERTDQEDKQKQLTQQVFNTEDAGWSSAVQTLKEMTSGASRSINEIAAAEQRA